MSSANTKPHTPRESTPHPTKPGVTTTHRPINNKTKPNNNSSTSTSTSTNSSNNNKRPRSTSAPSRPRPPTAPSGMKSVSTSRWDPLTSRFINTKSSLRVDVESAGYQLNLLITTSAETKVALQCIYKGECPVPKCQKNVVTSICAVGSVGCIKSICHHMNQSSIVRERVRDRESTYKGSKVNPLSTINSEHFEFLDKHPFVRTVMNAVASFNTKENKTNGVVRKDNKEQVETLLKEAIESQEAFNSYVAEQGISAADAKEGIVGEKKDKVKVKVKEVTTSEALRCILSAKCPACAKDTDYKARFGQGKNKNIKPNSRQPSSIAAVHILQSAHLLTNPKSVLFYQAYDAKISKMQAQCNATTPLTALDAHTLRGMAILKRHTDFLALHPFVKEVCLELGELRNYEETNALVRAGIESEEGFREMLKAVKKKQAEAEAEGGAEEEMDVVDEEEEEGDDADEEEKNDDDDDEEEEEEDEGDGGISGEEEEVKKSNKNTTTKKASTPTTTTTNTTTTVKEAEVKEENEEAMEVPEEKAGEEFEC